jgi:hypothetical protein
MTTTPTAFLSKPSGEDRIPDTYFAYVTARGRQQAFNLVHSEMKRNNVSQATLSRRTGMGPDVISRLLKRPSNIEQDTLSKLIFAVGGGAIAYRIVCPMTASSDSSVKQTEQTTTGSTADLPPKVWQPAAEAA